jgi:hypothetical protein
MGISPMSSAKCECNLKHAATFIGETDESAFRAVVAVTGERRRQTGKMVDVARAARFEKLRIALAAIFVPPADGAGIVNAHGAVNVAPGVIASRR